MRVVFRVDSSSEIGGGHLMRCLTLAERLAELSVEVSFICRDLPGNLIDVLKKKSFKVSVLPKSQSNQVFLGHDAWLGVDSCTDAFDTIDVISFQKSDWLVVDHYGIDEGWEKQLRPYVNKIMVIDDLANREHDCDILLDQNYLDGYVDRYKSLIPARCISMLGPQYILLRKEFRQLRNEKKLHK